MIKNVSILFLVLAMSGCIKDKRSTYKAPYINQYFPISEEFKTWVYEVNEIKYVSFSRTIDTTIFQYCETFDTFFEDNINRNAARFSRFKRLNDSAKWEFEFNYYVVAIPEYLERIENNTRRIRLSFPAVEDALWDENERNNNPQNLLFYTLLFKAYSGNYYNSNNCVRIENEGIKNNFEHKEFEQVYAKDIGLLYFKQVDKRKVQGFFDGYDRTVHLIERY